MDRLGFSKLSASLWLGDATKARRDCHIDEVGFSERPSLRALAHTVKNAVEAAYYLTDLLDQAPPDDAELGAALWVKEAEFGARPY
ncbi:MAG: hypothetical protein QE284_17285 [Rhizobium sp.]|nr:hypothetical protein [Rhizobium sp.]